MNISHHYKDNSDETERIIYNKRFKPSALPPHPRPPHSKQGKEEQFVVCICLIVPTIFVREYQLYLLKFLEKKMIMMKYSMMNNYITILIVYIYKLSVYFIKFPS